MGTLPKVLAIVGPTASGKTGLAVELAKQYSGEVISADSRQVYQYLDIGTEKATESEQAGIPHHLIDVAPPEEQITVVQYKHMAERAIADVHAHEKLPIVAGGTGFYIEALLDNVVLPEVPPNPDLRAQLAEKSTDTLFTLLKQRDSRRAKTIDVNNRPRLIRALEITEAIGRVPEKRHGSQQYNSLFIGIETAPRRLRERIHRRLNEALDRGLIEETRWLIYDYGLSWQRIDELGLEYRLTGRYIRGELSYEDLVTRLNQELWQYAKRQVRWFKRNERIHWYRRNETEDIMRHVANWLHER
jgi:tRNA dimethylallyltransferase